MISYTVEVRQLAENESFGEWNLSLDREYTVESWRIIDGALHRDGEPAVIIRDIRSGIIIGQQWFQNGFCHREGGPARIARLPSGNFEYAWYQKGELHRKERPARLVASDEPIPFILTEAWFQAGRRHRVGGPAYTHNSATTGVVTREEWALDGKSHRADGPASIDRDEWSGIVTNEEWSRDGTLHRLDGPALVERDG